MADDVVEIAKRQAEEYDSTVQTLLAFAALVVHDGSALRAGAQFGFGRRMDTSATNPIEPSNNVTPDLVAQKSPHYGVVAEIKRTLSRDTAQWANHVVQLRKYDDVLRGWWTDTESIGRSDVVGLIHQSRSVRFVHYLERKKDETPVGPSTSIVEFNQSNELNEYIFFRRQRGNLTDEEFDQRLEEGIPVPLSKVLTTFPNVRFYDAQPQLPWLLCFLWLHVFPAEARPEEHDEKSGGIPIRVTVDDITRELQSAFGSGQMSRDSRSVEFPKRAWVREAMEALVRLKLARRAGQNDAYTVILRKFHEDVLARFARLLGSRGAQAQETDDVVQTELPLTGEAGKGQTT